ncbi:MAG: OsmC family protein [Candidatus Thermoplasmatota archaeon]
MSGSKEKDGKTFTVNIERLEDYQFKVTFDEEEMGELVTDETESVGGEGKGPNPSRLLAASTLNCLMASLTFCLKKKRVEIDSLKGEVTANVERIDGKLRVTGLNADIKPELVDGSEKEKLKKCIDIFEDYCVVTQSIRKGVDVKVDVEV